MGSPTDRPMSINLKIFSSFFRASEIIPEVASRDINFARNFDFTNSLIIMITLVGRGVKVCELFFSTTTTQFSRRSSTFDFYHTSHQIISQSFKCVDWVSIE